MLHFILSNAWFWVPLCAQLSITWLISNPCRVTHLYPHQSPQKDKHIHPWNLLKGKWSTMLLLVMERHQVQLTMYMYNMHQLVLDADTRIDKSCKYGKWVGITNYKGCIYEGSSLYRYAILKMRLLWWMCDGVDAFMYTHAACINTCNRLYDWQIHMQIYQSECEVVSSHRVSSLSSPVRLRLGRISSLNGLGNKTEMMSSNYRSPQWCHEMLVGLL